MKKLAYASVALAAALVAICPGSLLCSPAFAESADGQAAQGPPPGSCSTPTIKDAAEYNDYANATSQSAPQAKADAIEAFLTKYPNSVAKAAMLEALMGAYQAAGNAAKILDAAKRLLQVEPNNLRALTFVVYLEHQQSNGNQATLDDAAAAAQTGLNAPKDSCMTQADYDKVKDLATPVFYSAIAADDTAKKDYKGAIDAYTKELQSYKDPTQTTVVPALLDTYLLGQAYLQEDPKDLKDAIWFLTRAAQFSKPPYQAQIETAAEYWYKKYHCAQNDAACNGTPPGGFSQVQQLAAVPANVFPPAGYNPTQAPPPPSPADLAHQAIVTTPGCANVTPAPPPATPAGTSGTAGTSGMTPGQAPMTPGQAPMTPGQVPMTPGTTPPGAAPGATTPPAPATPIPTACSDALKGMALGDKEFILSNGAAPDQAAIWGVMNGVTAEVPGVVVSATADSVELAVSQDAQQSNKADFTIKMKAPLKDVPTAGAKVTYIATFDSYTQNPPMIILKDGEPKAAPKAPVRHAPVHHPAR
jgi:hypothetical protein